MTVMTDQVLQELGSSKSQTLRWTTQVNDNSIADVREQTRIHGLWVLKAKDFLVFFSMWPSLYQDWLSATASKENAVKLSWQWPLGGFEKLGNISGLAPNKTKDVASTTEFCLLTPPRVTVHWIQGDPCLFPCPRSWWHNVHIFCQAHVSSASTSPMTMTLWCVISKYPQQKHMGIIGFGNAVNFVTL